MFSCHVLKQNGKNHCRCFGHTHFSSNLLSLKSPFLTDNEWIWASFCRCCCECRVKFLSSWKSSGLVLEQRAGTNMWNQKQKYCLSKGKKWNTSPSLSSIGHQQIHLLLICIELNFVQRLLPCWPSWQKIVKSSHLKTINFRVASCHSWSECRRRFLEMFQKHFKNCDEDWLCGTKKHR